MRKEYELTPEQLNELIEASRPVPYMVFGGIPPTSPQENANRAWERLGQELGFAPYSVRPIPGKSALFFTAEETKKTEVNK